MIEAFLLSLGQLFDRRIAAVLLKSLAVTALVFAGAGVGLWFGMHALERIAAAWAGGHESGWIADVLTILVFLFAWWLLFRAIAVAVVGLFADEVLDLYADGQE